MAWTGRVAAQVPGELRGQVVDQASGAPISGAPVEIAGQADRTTTAIDGRWMLRGLDPRGYTVRVRALGYAPLDTDVVLTNGRTTTLELALRPVVTRLAPVRITAARDSLPTGALTFDRKAIEASGRRDLGELLQGAPGLVITQAGGPGAVSRVSVRGSGANEVLVLVDGVAINSTISGVADLSRVALPTVDHVTVLIGAQSARYGAGALAGVILIETRRAEHDATAALGMGAWGERQASLSIGDSRAWRALRVGGSVTGDYFTTRGDFPYAIPDVRGGGTASRLNSGATSGSLLATASLRGDDGSLQARGEWQSTSRGLAGSIVQPSLTGHERESRLAGGLDGRWTAGAFAWTSNADISHEHAAFADPAPPFGGVYDDVVDANAVVLTTAGITATPLGALQVGAEGRLLDVSSTMLAAGAPRTQRRGGVWSSLHAARALSSAVSVAGDLSLRLDWDALLRGTTASPRAALTLSDGRLSVSGAIGQGYAPPSLGDQFFHEGVLVRPNPNLAPERVRRDLEVRAAAREVRAGPLRLGADVAVFHADIDGMILWVPDFRFIWSPSNFDVRRSGWEMSASAAAPSLGADLQGTLNRTDVTYTGAVLSGQVAYRPRTTASVTAGVTRYDARFAITTRYIGARRTVAGSALNQLDPYWLTDATLAVPLARAAWRVDLTLGLTNVFDRPAAMLVDYPFPGRTWSIALRTSRGRFRSDAPASP